MMKLNFGKMSNFFSTKKFFNVIIEMYFGSSIRGIWSLLRIVDKNGRDANIIAVRGCITNPAHLSVLEHEIFHKKKKLIGLCSYQEFPGSISNPNDPLSLDFLEKYGHHVILWCHCFRDPYKVIPTSMPTLLLSESDIYPRYKQLMSIPLPTNKKYDFFVYLPRGEWNDHVRGTAIAKRWLFHMSTVMNLKILLCGDERQDEFSFLTVIPQQDWSNFVHAMSQCRFLFCSSIYDASPRIFIDALCLDIPLLVNKDILGGWKYVTPETGMFFDPEDSDIDPSVTTFMTTTTFHCRTYAAQHCNPEDNARRFATTLDHLFSLHPKDLIDGVMYINLDSRKDRLSLIRYELNRIGIPLKMTTRIAGVPYPQNGHLGCCLSHLRCLRFAKQRQWKRFLILEDDFHFMIPKERFFFMIQQFLQEKQDNWDVFLLTAENVLLYSEEDHSQCIKRIRHATTTAGYLVHGDYIHSLYSCFDNARQHMQDEMIHTNDPKMYYTPYAIDQQWSALQATDRFFFTKPRIGKQADSRSSILSQ